MVDEEKKKRLWTCREPRYTYTFHFSHAFQQFCERNDVVSVLGYLWRRLIISKSPLLLVLVYIATRGCKTNKSCTFPQFTLFLPIVENLKERKISRKRLMVAFISFFLPGLAVCRRRELGDCTGGLDPLLFRALGFE
jgi:hypothetical protein